RAWGGAWAGKLKWGRLTHARVLQALKNPTYAGAYTFGKSRDVRKVQPDGSVRTSRRRRAREEWTVLIEDHHEGYLSWQEYLAVEAKLAANNTQKRARYDADRAERAFSNVEPENRLVARTLESRWETKLAALAESEAALATAKATKPPLPATDSLRSLAADLPRLWHADTTSPRDR